ncbi:MAG: restriction endonuclease subunit S [Caldisericum sp.]|uniref:restriction endonuclease subunit S n=1 Tax=Caldisericum sp. TaxID=2499687 RepID=UPI003D115AC0
MSEKNRIETDENLPEGWRRVRLGEVIKESKERNINNNVKVVLTISNLFGFVDQTEFFGRNLSSVDTRNYKVVKKFCYAYNPARINVGSIALNEQHEEAIVSPMYVVFKTEASLIPKFFRYHTQMKIFNNRVINNTAGSVRESLNFSRLVTFDFLLPPLHEQQKIAGILETVDNAIEKTDAIIEKYKRIKKGLMEDLLTGKIRLRPLSHSEAEGEESKTFDASQPNQFVIGGKAFIGIPNTKWKDSPLGKIPEDWEVKKLGEVCDIFDSQRIPLDENYRANIKGDIPYCGATGIIDYINDYIFNGEFVLIAEDGGKYSRFSETAYIMKGKFWPNNHVHIACGEDGILNNDFLKYFINYEDIGSYISGSTREKLNQQLLKNILLPLPPLQEQHLIAQVLSQVDSVIEKEQAYKEKLERIKKGLMEDLLTGKVRVNHLIKEGS